MSPQPQSLVICVNRRFRADQPSCAARGGVEIAEALEKGIAERRIDIKVERICCLGECTRGPNVRMIPGGDFHFEFTLEKVPSFLDSIERACGRLSAHGSGNDADMVDGPPVHLLGS